MPIPPEREITKTQLWERMDALISGVNSTIAGFQKNIDQQYEHTMAAVEGVFGGQVVVFLKAKDELKQQNVLFQKSLETQINDSHTYQMQIFNDFKKTLDAQLRAFRENTEKSADKKVDEGIARIQESLDLIAKSVIKYKADMDKQMNAYQVEMRKKIGEVVQMFDQSKKKFKKISEGLS